MERSLGGNYPNSYPGERRVTIVNKPAPPPPEPVPVKSNTGYVVGIIILIIIIVGLVILVIVLALRKPTNNTPVNTGCKANSDCPSNTVCQNGYCVNCITSGDCPSGLSCVSNVCVQCSTPPITPTNVSVVFNALGGTATVSWSASPGANSYNIYRKANDPSVGVNNYDQKDNTTATSKNYVSLPPGTTSYFVVTSVNTCGESPASTAVFSPSCASVLPQPPAPTVTLAVNNCLAIQASKMITVSFPNAFLPNGAYVIRGNNQYGTVDNYLYIVMQSSFGPATNITQKCNAVVSNHNLTEIRNVQSATITTPTPVPSPATQQTLSWQPVLGAEAYVYWMVAQQPVTGNYRFYGGFTNAKTFTATIPVNANDIFTYALVLGYRYCDISVPSANTTFP